MKSQATYGAKGAGGFSLIEVVFVIAIMLLFAAFFAPISGTISGSAQIDDATDFLVANMRLARARSVARFLNATHGVYFDVSSSPQRYIVYQTPDGASPGYAQRDASYDYVVKLPQPVTFIATPPGGDLYFLRSTGVPVPSSVTITLLHSAGGSRTIVINNLGAIEKQ